MSISWFCSWEFLENRASYWHRKHFAFLLRFFLCLYSLRSRMRVTVSTSVCRSTGRVLSSVASSPRSSTTSSSTRLGLVTCQKMQVCKFIRFLYWFVMTQSDKGRANNNLWTVWGGLRLGVIRGNLSQPSVETSNRALENLRPDQIFWIFLWAEDTRKLFVCWFSREISVIVANSKTSSTMIPSPTRKSLVLPCYSWVCLRGGHSTASLCACVTVLNFVTFLLQRRNIWKQRTSQPWSEECMVIPRPGSRAQHTETFLLQRRKIKIFSFRGDVSNHWRSLPHFTCQAFLSVLSHQQFVLAVIQTTRSKRIVSDFFLWYPRNSNRPFSKSHHK